MPISGGATCCDDNVPSTPVVVLDASPIAYDAGASDNFIVQLTVLGGNTRELSVPSNLVAGMGWVVKLKQPLAGATQALTLPATYKPANQTAPVLTATNGVSDILTCYYDGTVINCSLTTNYAG